MKLVCGVHEGGTSEEKEEQMAMKTHLQDLANLKQSRWEKVVLAVGMLTILAIGVAMYIFWSTYKFQTVPFYPSNATVVLPGDGGDHVAAV